MHMLGKIIRIMEVYHAFLMGMDHMLWQEEPLCNVLADFPCHIIPLDAVHNWVLVGIFLLDFFIIAFYQAQNLLVRRIGLAHQRPFVTVSDIFSGNLKCIVGHNFIFHHVLNFFYIINPLHVGTNLGNPLRDCLNLPLG